VASKKYFTFFILNLYPLFNNFEIRKGRFSYGFLCFNIIGSESEFDIIYEFYFFITVFQAALVGRFQMILVLLKNTALLHYIRKRGDL